MTLGLLELALSTCRGGAAGGGSEASLATCAAGYLLLLGAAALLRAEAATLRACPVPVTIVHWPGVMQGCTSVYATVESGIAAACGAIASTAWCSAVQGVQDMWLELARGTAGWSCAWDLLCLCFRCPTCICRGGTTLA